MHMYDRTSAFKVHLIELRTQLLDSIQSESFKTACGVLGMALLHMDFVQIKRLSYIGAIVDRRGKSLTYTDPGNFIYTLWWCLTGLAVKHALRRGRDGKMTKAFNGFLGIQKGLLARWPKQKDSPQLCELIGDFVEMMFACSYKNHERYLVAFGQSRHRALVVGQRPHGRWLGSRGWPLGGLWEAVWGPLGGRFGASWGLIWAFWGPLGASWGALMGLLGPLWGLLGPPWGILGRKARFFSFLSRSWAPLGPVLGASWAVLGGSWAVLGPSWAVLGPSWGPLGPSWSGHRGFLVRLGTSESRLFY